MSVRHALYWTPEPTGPLAAFGARWLGHDPVLGGPVPRLVVADLAHDRHDAATASPRRYGLHATLKPPFRLRHDATGDELNTRLAAFAGGRSPVAMPALRLADLDGFLALVPDDPCPALHDLADAVVEFFDDLRAAPDEAELARRREGGLSEAQEANLQRWGYPYVFGEFRFHVTLTGRLPDTERAALRSVLEPLVAPFCGRPWSFDALSLMRQDDGAPFVLVERPALRG